MAGSTTSFAYDAAGIRVKTIKPNGTVIDTPFPGYEVENATGTATGRLTFAIAGQTVALKVMGTSTATYYLYNDHLGSVGKMSTTAGSTVTNSTARYYPFGDWRTEPTAGLTDMGYTGHRHNNLGSGATDIGLIYMNARWYLPGLGRFISADTLVPDPINPQGWNRYSYVANNPLRLIEPSGHCWGFASGLRSTFMGTTCGNLDNAWTIVTSPDASAGQKIAAGAYIAVEAVAHTTVVVGTVVATGGTIAEAVPAVTPYIYAGAAAVETAAAAYPTTAAVVGGLAETAAECSLTGGGCGAADYVVGGLTAGVAHRLSNPSSGSPCSFSADTPVMTEDGLVAIAEIEAGTWVLAYDEERGEVGYYPVVAAWSHDDPVIVYLTIDGEVIETTLNHPFLTKENEWVQAGSLQPGDEIRDAHMDIGAVETITITITPQTMYNFTVATAHTYFVGEGQWLVHNACGPNDVGLANELRSNSTIGDGLDIHHVPQSHPASQVIPNYNSNTAPAIALPEAIHDTIPRMRGSYEGTPRDLLANDLWNLRQAGVPNDSLRQLIDLNRNTYPGVFE